MELKPNEQIVFITGATSGIGRVAACNLAQNGAKVIATARNEERGKELTSYFESEFPESTGKIEYLICDLSSFESIIEAVAAFKKKFSKLDLLINNAGIINHKFSTSKNEIEETFHVNVLAPMLLIHLLGELIITSKGRIIITSSILHHGTINFKDIEGRINYSGLNAYRQSKLVGLLLIKEISKRLNDTGAHIYSHHPGIVKTNLARNSNWIFKYGLNLIGVNSIKGAETLIFLATSPKEKLMNGKYYARKRIWRTKPKSNNHQMARELLKISKQYLAKYIYEPSFIFNTQLTCTIET